MLKKIKIKLKYLIHKQWLTQLSGWIANKKCNIFTTLIIKLFIKFYKVNMLEAKESDVSYYSTFNDFFTRSLKENARPIIEGNNKLSLPADGIISQLGSIKDDKILQAKGHYYDLKSLLANNDILVNNFYNGIFITIYLSPRDYHRIHMPCNGLLTEMIYIPGKLFSVNKLATIKIPNIFTQNERLICIFDTPFGKMAQILVGAIIVGRIETSWCSCINNKHEKIIKYWTYPKKNKIDAIYLKKGEEMGKFKLGSTVINLFEFNHIKLNSVLAPGSITRVGELLAISNYLSAKK
ncbi:MAG: archaetidylserine decarboxylase [Arsenophonus endosymbiont of Ceratovacuna japonica]